MSSLLSVKSAAANIIEGPPQQSRLLPLLFLIDTSGSMEGPKLSSVNAAVRNVIPDLQALESKTPGVEIVVQIVAFDDDARYIYPAAVPVSKLTFVPLETGVTSNMGAGLILIRDEFEKMAGSGDSFKKPVLVVLSDGAVANWEVPLQELLAINMGNASQRIAFAVGNDADKNMLRNMISKDQDKVHEVHSAGELAKMLILASVSAAEEATRGKSSALSDTDGGFKVPEINTNLFPAEAVNSSEDVAKKLNLDSKLIF